MIVLVLPFRSRSLRRMCGERSCAPQAGAGSNRCGSAMTGLPAQSVNAGDNHCLRALGRAQPESAQVLPLREKDDIYDKDCFGSGIGQAGNGRISRLPVNLRGRELLPLGLWEGQSRALTAPRQAFVGLRGVTTC